MRGRDAIVLLVALVVAECGREAKAPAAAPPAPITAAAAANAALDVKELPRPATEGGIHLYAALARRRSRRTYAPGKLDDAEISQLLWAGQGITSRRGFRTAPSAGALYPLTLYYADDLAVWRYEPKGHRLLKALAGDRRGELARAGLGQAPLKRAPAVIIIVARPAITARKYRGRAERYCMLEAGHVAQNILLAATSLDLGAIAVGAFRDGDVRAALGLDEQYLPLYLVAVGKAFEP